MSRVLTCTHCGEAVTVDEEPVEFLDAERYVCGDHLRPVQLDDDREPQVGPFQIPERARAAA